jgi:hypothetical protein
LNAKDQFEIASGKGRKAVGPQQVINNPGKELKMRSIFLLRASILGIKRAL